MEKHGRYLSKQTSVILHGIIEVLAISILSIFGIEALVSVTNLYQPKIYILLSFYVYLLLVIWLLFVFDTRSKSLQPISSVIAQFKTRFEHFLVWKNLRHFQNYLTLPSVVYWGTVILIGINFGHRQLQQILAVCSSLALISCYSFFGTIFRKEITEENELQFLILTYVKIYAAWLIFAGMLGITWYYCFPTNIYYLGVFTGTFILLYQALFQFHANSFKNILWIVGISILITLLSVAVYHFWNVNYFTAGLFLTAVYNFCWNILFHSAKHKLSPELLIEQITFLVMILIIVFGLTNFRERIDRC